MDTIRGLRGVLIGLLLLGACAPAAGPPAAKPAAPTPPAAASPAAPAPGGAPTAAPAAVAPLSPPVTVRYGALLTLALAPFLIAEQRGYFAEEGIEAEFNRFDSGARMVAPMSAGQLEVGAGSHSAGLFNALASGLDLKIVADGGTLIPGRNTSQIVARKQLAEQGVHGADDLRGHTFAFTATGSTVHINVMRFLELNGVQANEVSLTEMGFPDMNAALSNGAIDFADQSEPLAMLGADQGILTRLTGVADYYPNREVSVLMYSGNFIEQQPEAARRFMVAYLRGIRAYEDAFTKNVDHDAVVDLLAENLPVKDRSLYDRMMTEGTLLYLNPDGTVATESIAWDQDWLARNGLVRTKVDLGQVIDHSFVDYALGRIGHYAGR